MRIKVLTLKDIIKYLAKISIIFGVIAVFANFFYSQKNVKSYFKFDTSQFLGTIKNEILPLKNDEELKLDLSSKTYISNTINSELGMLKTVATTNLTGTMLGNNNSSENTNNEEKKGETNNINSNENEQKKLQEAQTGVNTEILPSNIPDKTTYELFGVKIRNESDYNLQNEITDLNVDFNKKDIIIFHTHTCESYTPTEQNQYNSTGNYRTTDLNYSVARVGDELENYLSNYGYTVVHDKSYHDYPAYNGSYNRSLVTVNNLLETYKSTDVVIDLHRDAIGDNTYAPKVKIGDDYCARIMFVIGTDGGGLSHPNWRENLKFAMKVVQKGNELYPGLFKPVIVRNSRYNHQVSKAACIIEVGATGNTLEECLNSMKYLSKIYDEM
ncbi:MAG: stage II sporulation protein P [Clostridia bacterium]|nr:stage II sporulation protein P [Clostridia bacterium]